MGLPVKEEGESERGFTDFPASAVSFAVVTKQLYRNDTRTQKKNYNLNRLFRGTTIRMYVSLQTKPVKLLPPAINET
jgi:hypothetical protein